MDYLERVDELYFLGCASIMGIIFLLAFAIAVIEIATDTILADWLEFLHLPSGKIKREEGMNEIKPYS
ncbi:MAG: hypothetical protein Q7K11_01815 [Candidatus Berkelbacteria bacterium]|nr:hypothetical protein [Candidatus Berkelbacteria bacterium]